MRTMNIGVYALYPYVPGTSTSTPFSDEFVRWLFDENANFSLRRYWREVSGGELDIKATIFGFIFLEGQEYISRLCQTKREPSANEAVRILFEIDQDPGPYDGLVFIIGGRVVDGGSTSVFFGGKTRPVCYFDDRGSHSFMAHELGHLLGLDHPFDTALTNPTYTYGEYGDPTCIMSAENYGGFGATFAIPPASRIYANSNIRFWQSAGPGVSMMTMFRYALNYPASQAFSFVLPAGAAPTPIRLYRAGTHGVQLVLMPSTGSNSWYGVEYRTSTAWDRGLIAEKSGLVIHQIRNQVGNTTDGIGWPKFNKVCLAGVISIPGAYDLDWNDSNFGVRVTQYNPDWVDLVVGATLPGDQYVILHADTETTFVSSGNAERIRVSRTGSDCGVHEYTAIRSNEQVNIKAEAISSGFATPHFRYELNGIQLNSWTSPGTATNGSVILSVDVEVPVTLSNKVIQSRNISILFAGLGNTMSIIFPPGDGEYQVALKCFVSDNSVAGETGVASGEMVISVMTAKIQLPAEAVEDQGRCIARMADELRQIPVWPSEETHPDWRIPERNRNWRQEDFARVADRIRNIAELERRFPAVGSSEFSNLATELNLSVADLHMYADQLSLQLDH